MAQKQLNIINPPKISVVCPTYNSEGYIRRTLDSIFTQKCPPHELIISDDGSTDGTVSIIQNYIEKNNRFPAVLLRNTHRGPGAARNRGIETASGEWIAFLDADDLWNKDKLSTVQEHIQKHPDKNLFSHDETYVRLDGSQEVLEYGRCYNDGQPLPRQMFLRNFFSTSTVVCRKDLLEKAGFFDEDLPSAQDYEMWLKASPHIKPFFIKKVLGYYMEREGSITCLYYWKKYRHLMRIALRHRGKATLRDLFRRVIRLSLSKSWLHSLSNYLSGRTAHN